MATEYAFQTTATLPDGREVFLYWEGGNGCVDAKLVNPSRAEDAEPYTGDDGGSIDIFWLLGREACEAWFEDLDAKAKAEQLPALVAEAAAHGVTLWLEEGGTEAFALWCDDDLMATGQALIEVLEECRETFRRWW